jgi:hypothetical protein
MSASTMAQQEDRTPSASMSLVVTLNGNKLPTKNGRKTVQVGELVRVDLRDSDLTGIDIDILPSSKDFEIIDGGKRAYFSSRVGGEYLVLIAGAKEGSAALGYFRIIVKCKSAPTPATQEVARLCEDWIALVEEYEGKNEHIAAVAGVFRKLADKQDVKVENMLEATAVANSAILGDSLDRWLPFFDKLGGQLDEYGKQGKIKSRDDYRQTWLAISDGIENG